MSSSSEQSPARQAQHGTFLSYLSGFVLSVFLTLYAYISVVHHSFSGKKLMAWLLGLAVVQFCVQLFFFLHIGRETRPRWKLAALFSMIVVVLLVVLGSLWIMYNLNYRMTPDRMNRYLQQQDGGI